MSGCDREFHMLLAAKGIDLNRTDEVGETARFTATLINDYTRVLELLQADADPTVRDKLGRTFQAFLNITPEGAGATALLRSGTFLTAFSG